MIKMIAKIQRLTEKQRSSRRGAAVMTVMIIASVIGLLLSSLFILVRGQVQLANRMDLRLVAERLNNSAADILNQLLNEGRLNVDNYVGINAHGFIDQLGVASSRVVVHESVSETDPNYVQFDFCPDLDWASDIKCYPTDTPTPGSTIPSTQAVLTEAKKCVGNNCIIGIEITTQLLNPDKPDRPFRYVSDYWLQFLQM